jgi:hypothetical protein
MKLFRLLPVAVVAIFLGPIPIRADTINLSIYDDPSNPLWVGDSLVGNVIVSYFLNGQQESLLFPVDIITGYPYYVSDYVIPVTEWAPGANWQLGLWIVPPSGAQIPIGVAFGEVQPPADPPNAATIQTLYYGTGCSGLLGPCYPSEVVYSGCLSGTCTLVPGSALYWTLYGYDGPSEFGTISVWVGTPEPSTVLLLATGLLALAIRKRIADGVRRAT